MSNTEKKLIEPVYDVWYDFNFKMKMLRQNDNWQAPKMAKKKKPAKIVGQGELF